VSTLFNCLSVLVAALTLGFTIKKRNFLQAAPTLTWFTLMTLPLIYTWNFFPPSTRIAQSAGILMISIALSFGDAIASKIKSTQKNNDISGSSRKSSRLIFLISWLVIIIPLFHFYLVGSIPVFDQIFRGMSLNSVSTEREDFVKLLDVPYFIKVLFNWVSTIFGPICITWFWVNKRKILSACLFLWVLLYSIASSASGPILLFIWVLSFAFSHSLVAKKLLQSALAVGIAGALLFCVASGVWLGNTATSIASSCLDSSFKTFTPGDVFRGCQNEPGVWINPVVNRAGYRIFLTPVEVSNHWYDFFDGDPSKKRNFLDIFERTNSKQASNKVGVWAYTDRFPASYGKTISANGSIDADAFSLGGIPAIALASLLLLLIRIFISMSFSDESLFIRILEGIGLAQLAWLTNSAPLQAILLPQGLG